MDELKLLRRENKTLKATLVRIYNILLDLHGSYAGTSGVRGGMRLIKDAVKEIEK